MFFSFISQSNTSVSILPWELLVRQMGVFRTVPPALYKTNVFRKTVWPSSRKMVFEPLLELIIKQIMLKE